MEFCSAINYTIDEISISSVVKKVLGFLIRKIKKQP